MSDQVVQLAPDSSGKKIDVSETTVGANTVERQRIVIADDLTAAALVKILNSAPAGTEFALVVRNIPSGVQPSSLAFGSGVPYGTGDTYGGNLTYGAFALGKAPAAYSLPVVLATDQSIQVDASSTLQSLIDIERSVLQQLSNLTLMFSLVFSPNANLGGLMNTLSAPVGRP